MASATVAAFGLALLAYLLLTRAFTPPHSLYARALLLDYAAADIVGEAAFLPLAQVAAGVIPADLPPGTRCAASAGAWHLWRCPPARGPCVPWRAHASARSPAPRPRHRVLQPGQVADVWVELRVPRTLPSGGGMVQLVAELTSADGKLAGRASKPVLMRSAAGGAWSTLTAPARWAGLCADSSLLVVPLLSGYREATAPPALIFRLYIKVRRGSGSRSIWMSLWERRGGGGGWGRERRAGCSRRGAAPLPSPRSRATPRGRPRSWGRR